MGAEVTHNPNTCYILGIEQLTTHSAQLAT